MISSHPRRSTSNGFILTSVAGNGQFRLCCSIALAIASRFLPSALMTDSVCRCSEMIRDA